MGQQVFKYRGRGLAPVEARARLDEATDLALVEEADRELVVTGTATALKRFGRELEGWFCAPVRTIPRPSVGAMRHPRVRRVN